MLQSAGIQDNMYPANASCYYMELKEASLALEDFMSKLR
jgi:hypothetical protein